MVDDLECENAGTLISCDVEHDACEGHPPHTTSNMDFNPDLWIDSIQLQTFDQEVSRLF